MERSLLLFSGDVFNTRTSWLFLV